MIPSLSSRLPWRMKALAGCALLWFLVLAAAQPAHASAPSPLVVDADDIIYDESAQVLQASGHVRLQYRGIRLTADAVTFDLQREFLTARGNVELIDADGRELRGETLTYDVRLNVADLTKAQTVTSGFTVRSESLRRKDTTITALNSVLTTCPPNRPPAYRITARSIEIIPGQRLVARSASLWVGSLRVLTLPVLVVSLRSPEETARSLPRIGYNNVDGFWIEYQHGYNLGAVGGILFAKYGSKSGIVTRNSLLYSTPSYALDLTIGRSSGIDYQLLDQAEFSLRLPSKRIGSSPVFFSGFASYGTFYETKSGNRSTRFQYEVDLRMPPVRFGKASWDAGLTWLERDYGLTGRRTMLGVSSTLIYPLTEHSSLGLRYSLIEVQGASSPFYFDEISERPHRLTVGYEWSGLRGPGVGRIFKVDAGYDFRDPGFLATGAYGERLPERFHWLLGIEYHAASQVLKLSTDSGISLGRGTYFTVQAIYNVSARAFEDLDFIVRSTLCDCINLSLMYRQVRQELWLEIGLTAVPGARLTYLFQPP